MLIYASTNCVGGRLDSHLCDWCFVELVLPGTLDVLMTSWASYKAAVLAS